MRKAVLLLVASVTFASGHAHSFWEQDGKVTKSQMGSVGDTSMGRPRTPRNAPIFQVWYEPGLSAVLVSSRTDVGLVRAVIENIYTGTFYTYSFDSSELAVLPITGEAGEWRIMLHYSWGWRVSITIDI